MPDFDDDLPHAAGLTSANTRARKVAKFMGKRPARATQLLLVAGSEDGEAQLVLGRWEPEELTHATAQEIVDTLDDHATEAGGHIVAQLCWATEQDKVVATMVLKRQANHVLDDANASAQGLNAQLTGDARSIAIHGQVQVERMSKVYMAGIASLLVHSERLVTRQAEMLERMSERTMRAETRADKLARELDELTDALRSADPDDGPPPAMERALKLVEALAPHVMAKMMAPATPPNGKAD